MKNPELYAAILSVAGALGRVANDDPSGPAALDDAFEHLLATDPDASVHGTYRWDWNGARTYSTEKLRQLAVDYASLAAGEVGGGHEADLAFMAEVAAATDGHLAARLADLPCEGWQRIAVERELGRRNRSPPPPRRPPLIDELLYPASLTVPPPPPATDADP